MSSYWPEINERRISEKTQEIQLYCGQKKSDMTPRAFDLARLSFEQLLNNIMERNPRAESLCKSIRLRMSKKDECVAPCSEKQAACLARDVVYNYIGDDLNLYPVSAEGKLLRAKVRGKHECDIHIEEMTPKDIIFVMNAITEGESFSKQTMQSVLEWFRKIGMDPIQARVFSVLFIKQKPLSIKDIPQQNLFVSEYRKAAKALVKAGFICELPDGFYCVTEMTIA